MKEEIIHIKSINQLTEMGGFDKPKHPLITIVDASKWVIPASMMNVKVVADLYSISLKDKSCGLQYGRNTYDFDEGVLIFTAPSQVQSVTKEQKLGEVVGWSLFFHPDLIRNTPLGKTIDNYKFFSYDVHEALHLSDDEQNTITNCIDLIQNEISERIDNHSQTVISSSLELLLNLSQRYYERQFNTRSAKNTDVVSRFNELLKQYYSEKQFAKNGIPTIEYFSNRVNLSANYLSDLLKKETGYNAKEQINNFIIDKAKTLLLSQTDSVSGIAYELGFNYPHYFSRLFKKRTGVTPQEYRQMN